MLRSISLKARSSKVRVVLNLIVLVLQFLFSPPEVKLAGCSYSLPHAKGDMAPVSVGNSEVASCIGREATWA